MLVGYARVSTEDQTLDSQLNALKNFGVDERHIFKEQMSGNVRDRQELKKVLDYLKKGDTLVVYKLDRLGRSVSHLIEIMNFLKEKEIIFHSITECIETKTAVGKLIFNVMATLAEFERSLTQERINAGIAAAKARGVKFGRRENLNKVQKELIRELLRKGMNKYDIMRTTGLKSRTPIYRLIEQEKLTWANKNIKSNPEPLFTS